MSYIDHSRPQLRLLDNWRRELSRLPVPKEAPIPLIDWPPALRPVAAKPKALEALFAMLEALNRWFDEEAGISLGSPPDYVRRAFDEFAASKVENTYDPRFNGRDWLVAGHHEETEQDIRPALLSFFKGCL